MKLLPIPIQYGSVANLGFKLEPIAIKYSSIPANTGFIMEPVAVGFGSIPANIGFTNNPSPIQYGSIDMLGFKILPITQFYYPPKGFDLFPLPIEYGNSEPKVGFKTTEIDNKFGFVCSWLSFIGFQIVTPSVF